MNVVLIVALGLATARGPVLDGRTTYYAPGVMERVVAYRGLDLDGRLPVALNDCRHLGRAVWIEHGGETRPALVVDCAQRRHVAERERRGYVAEVGYPTARAWGMVGVGPAPIRVWLTPPRAGLPEAL